MQITGTRCNICLSRNSHYSASIAAGHLCNRTKVACDRSRARRMESVRMVVIKDYLQSLAEHSNCRYLVIKLLNCRHMRQSCLVSRIWVNLPLWLKVIPFDGKLQTSTILNSARNDI